MEGPNPVSSAQGSMPGNSGHGLPVLNKEGNLASLDTDEGDEGAVNGGGGAISIALVLNQNAAKFFARECHHRKYTKRIRKSDKLALGRTLSKNNLNGTIPESLGNLPSLINVMFDSNDLSGEIWEQLFKVTMYK
ncbi:putative LRR receptor-like serine/threonine-protein kinase [Arachis hypogaea]|nr:putative LRR receptor-like serine/threonine-protein kinase [Arachis hypogaea]